MNDSDWQKMGELMDEKLDAKFKAELASIKVELKDLEPIRAGLASVQAELKDKTELKDLEPIRAELASVKNELKKLRPIQKDIRKIKTDLSTIADSDDRRLIDHDKRLDRIDTHLGFPPIPPTLRSH